MSTLSANSSLTVTLDGFSLAGNKSSAATLNGINGTGASIDANTGSWVSIDVTSLSDFRYGWFYNDTTGSGVILVATGSGGQNVICKLQPGDTALVPWSGSVASLYTSAVVQNSTLQYVLTES